MSWQDSYVNIYYLKTSLGRLEIGSQLDLIMPVPIVATLIKPRHSSFLPLPGAILGPDPYLISDAIIARRMLPCTSKIIVLRCASSHTRGLPALPSPYRCIRTMMATHHAISFQHMLTRFRCQVTACFNNEVFALGGCVSVDASGRSMAPILYLHPGSLGSGYIGYGGRCYIERAGLSGRLVWDTCY